ncbi:hypothetical protein HanIR_Chr17g0882221 [Helianthus annuus]|nr:hypothetical protein HanIR_Chr17g0882221 [Helianthus annuus]
MHNMLAMPVENFKIILFHYDGKLDCWQDLEWNSKAIHVVAQNRTKC